MLDPKHGRSFAEWVPGKMQVDPKNIRESAQQMIALHGDRAATAAREEYRRLSQAGETEEANSWERLYKAILHVQRKG